MKQFNMLKQSVFSVLLLVFMALNNQAWSAGDFFDESFGNYQEELTTASDEGKMGVFVFFHMEECPFCHRMRSTILTQPDVIAKYKKHFMNFEIDIEGSNEVVDFDGTATTAIEMSEKKYRVRATPVMMIFDLEGRPILKYTGPTRTKEEFMWLADYVVGGHNKTMSFTKYKRERKRELRQ